MLSGAHRDFEQWILNHKRLILAATGPGNDLSADATEVCR